MDHGEQWQGCCVLGTLLRLSHQDAGSLGPTQRASQRDPGPELWAARRSLQPWARLRPPRPDHSGAPGPGPAKGVISPKAHISWGPRRANIQCRTGRGFRRRPHPSPGYLDARLPRPAAAAAARRRGDCTPVPHCSGAALRPPPCRAGPAPARGLPPARRRPTRRSPPSVPRLAPIGPATAHPPWLLAS